MSNAKPNQAASRLGYAIATLVVILIGLASRRYQWLFPSFLEQYPGDALWALMVYLGLGFFFPKIKIILRAEYALAISYIVEVSQLYKIGWLDSIRSTTLGHLILGQGFNFKDLIAYTIGVCLGVFWEKCINVLIAKYFTSNTKYRC
ncbi:MAG: DUF2809 domain-containing protein [Thermosynechococcaceae cyanobacterium]